MSPPTTPSSPARSSSRTPGKKFFRSALGLLFGLGFWQLAAHLAGESSVLPAPLQVAHALSEMGRSGELFQDAGSSLSRIFSGFLIALVASMVLGVTAVRFSRVYDYVEGIMSLLGSIPPIAWTPLAILWFGIGNAPAYFIVFLGAFFPMFLNWYSGITGVDRTMIEAARTLGASPSKIVTGVILPAALPQILTGIRAGIAIAWFNVIAAELIGVRAGLGYKIQLNRTLLFSDYVVALMIVIGVLGFLMTRLVEVVGNLMTPWAIQVETRSSWLRRRRWIAEVFLSHRYRSSPPKLHLSPPHAAPPTSSRPLLEVNRLFKSYDGQGDKERLSVLEEISFTVHGGEVFSIIGPNGSGKTTLLTIIAGLLNSDRGSVRFLGEEIRSPSPRRVLVFQNFALFPWLTCRGNIEFALHAAASAGHWQTSQEASQRALEFLAEAKLTAFADAYPFELSGGMRQRLALLRALAVDPDLILLDEPFASFDPLVRSRSQEDILELLARRPVTILLVTHDLDEALFMSDRILVLSERPGRVKEIVKVDFSRPRTSDTRRAAEFMELRSELWELLQSTTLQAHHLAEVS